MEARGRAVRAVPRALLLKVICCCMVARNLLAPGKP